MFTQVYLLQAAAYTFAVIALIPLLDDFITESYRNYRRQAIQRKRLP